MSAQYDDGTILLDDATLERFHRATGGEAWPCYQCGTCTATCPWGRVRQEPLLVRTLMRNAQLGIDEDGESLWLCTSCGICEDRCPRGVPIVRILRALRSLAWKDRRIPEGLPSVLWAVHRDGNPYSLPPCERTRWADDLEVKEFEPTDEMLLYLGCTASYDRRIQKVARSVVGGLRAAGVQFGTLGASEPCCGETALAMGQTAFAAEIAEANAKLFAARGVKTVVTISPHCFDMFQNHTPRLDEGFEALHYTQFLARLVSAGRLVCRGSFPRRVAFHDPCYLGRRNGEYDAPRTVLESIPGAEIVELEESRAGALCCGAGGGRMFLETPVGERFSDLRVRQAANAGAEVLATACPFCITCLEESAPQVDQPLKVMDVAEIAARALEPEGADVEATASGR
ncbi:MAG: hypothetical protein CMJ83_12225 [Planctomycetes bacterium]|nr:hypothetical protein [Planctomycetota bacterium]